MATSRSAHPNANAVKLMVLLTFSGGVGFAALGLVLLNRWLWIEGLPNSTLVARFLLFIMILGGAFLPVITFKNTFATMDLQFVDKLFNVAKYAGASVALVTGLVLIYVAIDRSIYGWAAYGIYMIGSVVSAGPFHVPDKLRWKAIYLALVLCFLIYVVTFDFTALTAFLFASITLMYGYTWGWPLRLPTLTT